MALLSLEMIREIRGVADAYAARERERVAAPARPRDAREVQARHEGNLDNRR